MEHIIQALKRTDGEKRIPQLHLEIDEELLRLHEAMLAEDLSVMDEIKRKLTTLRQEMMLLEGFEVPEEAK